MISSKNYWELEAQIHTAYGHSLVLHGLSIKFAQTQRNGVQLARRPHSNIEILLQVMTCLCGANHVPLPHAAEALFEKEVSARQKKLDDAPVFFFGTY